jgi:phosphoribosylanthranilate isomerase
MNPTRVKICGVCRPQDAIAAAEAGADAIGLILHGPSKRILTAKQANQILAVVPPYVTTVGLFVNANPKKLASILRQTPVQLIQLQGHETPEFVAALKPVPVVKAIHVDHSIIKTLKMWKKAIAKLKLTNLKGILLETASGIPGGSGIPNDWNAIRRLQRSGALKGLPPLIAAGGLTPKTVGKVVRLLRPYAVDVASGVESDKRKKSPEKIQKFIRAVRIADATEP